MIITDKEWKIEMNITDKEYEDLFQIGVSKEMLGIKDDRLDTQAGIKLKDFNTIWNMAIEIAARWLETADRNDTDDAAEIRKLKQ